MKFIRCDLRGGVYPLNQTNIAYRARDFLTVIGQKIIDSNEGWILDYRRHTDLSDQFHFKVFNSSGTIQSSEYPAYFFINTISGCKMFIGANPANSQGVALLSPNVVLYENLTYTSHIGIVISIIPADSDEEFGTVFDENFIPPTATKVIGTCGSTNTSYYQQYFRKNTSGYYYTYGFFIDPYWIGIAGGCSSDNTHQLKLGILVGKIFGNLMHYETLPQAQYGCVKFTKNDSSNDSEFLNYNISSYSIQNNYNFLGYSTSFTGSLDTQRDFGMCFSATGNPIFGNRDPSFLINVYGAYQLESCYTNSSASDLTRWCPYILYILSSDLETNGVTRGDGIKGFLDTDIIRACVNNYGQLYNDNTFIGLGNGIVIRWNPNNVDSI